MEEHPEFDLCATQIAFMTERGKVAWDKRQPKTPGSMANPTAKCFLKTSALIRRSRMGRRSFEEPYSRIRQNTERHSSPAEDIDMWLRFLGHAPSRCTQRLHLAPSPLGQLRHRCARVEKPLLPRIGQGILPRSSTGRAGRIGEDRENHRAPLRKTPLLQNHAPPGRQNFRGDLLGFHYSVVINARDWSRNYPDHSNGLAGWLATEANLSRDFFPLVAYSSGQNGSMVQRENTGGD